MRQIISISLFSILLASASVFAADHQHMNQDAKPSAGQQWSHGVVKKVDQKAGKVTLKHEAIENVMPAMTMSYHIASPASLSALHAGDKVRFVLDKTNDDYVVSHIEVVR